MSGKQPEALRLADMLDVATAICAPSDIDVAAELRRQHELIQEMRQALTDLLKEVYLSGLGDAKDYGWPVVVAGASAAISKAKDAK